MNVAGGITDEAYLSSLREALPRIIESEQPSFAFFLSGVDILDTDKFGKLKVTPAGCRQWDEFVFTLLKQHHIPCTVAMGGGYSPQVKQIVDAHCNTFKAAKSIYELT